MHVPVIVKLNCNIEGIQYCFEDVTNALLEKEGSNLEDVREENRENIVIQIKSTQETSQQCIDEVIEVLKRFNILSINSKIIEDGRYERINDYK